jgi:hypothetical protein
MGLTSSKLAAATAVAAAFSMLPVPAAAVELPMAHAAKAYDADAGNVHRHKRGRWRHRDRVDAGDILTGVLILGGIAAIAGAVENNDRDEPYLYPPPPPPQPRYDASPRYESGAMERAVENCVSTVEDHGARVAGVDSAARRGDVWDVAGSQESGAPWSCSIDQDGVLVDLEIGDYETGQYETGAASPAEGPWSDEDYARARAAQGLAEPYPATEAGV